MARIVLPRPSIVMAIAPRRLGWTHLLTLLMLAAGCASAPERPVVPADIAPAGVAARVLAPPEQIKSPAEAIVLPGISGQPSAPPSANPSLDSERTIFSLADAVAFALQNSPRLRAARAAIQRASGQEQVNFAPFLPQVDLLGQYGTVSSTLAPGTPGPEGFILASGTGTRAYTETELGLQWMLYDFGRTSGRYRQAVARERVAELQLVRANQAVEFDVAAAYLEVLLASASKRVEEDAVRRAEAILDDTVARRKGGVGLREDVLRAEVQLSESREDLVVAREREFNALARLNNFMGRNASLPLEVIDLEMQPPLPGSLTDLLATAAAQRPEIRLAQQSVAAAEEGRRAAKADFLPQIFVRASAGRTDGENVVTGWQEGAGLHLEAPLYDGGRRSGDFRSADADVGAAVAEAQDILDAVGLEVNLAYHGVVASHERIELSRVAVSQAQENLRVESVSYRNGNATPTDIVDGEAALTRAQQRFYSSTYSYLVALARLDYAMGQQRVALPTATDNNKSEELPIQGPTKTDNIGSERIPAPNRLPEVKDSKTNSRNDN
jgi:outer membrane protein